MEYFFWCLIDLFLQASILDFLSDTEIFNLNLLKLIKYIEKSKIGFKLRGFSQRNFEDKKDKPVSSGVGAFLASLNKGAVDTSTSPAEKENTTAALESLPMTSSPIFVVDEFLRCLVTQIELHPYFILL